jgi:DNA-binding beta-propeller fold protein YncE
VIHFNRPVSIGTDGESIFVTTRDWGRIYHFSAAGDLIKKIQLGENVRLRGIRLLNNQIYVVNQTVCRVMILDKQLTIRNYHDLSRFSPLLDSIDVDHDGTIFCTDQANHCIYKINSDGSVSVMAAGKLSSPRGIRVAGDYIYVCDRDNDRICRIHKNTLNIRTFLSWGRGNGRVRKPVDIEFYQGLFFVCDQDNYLVQIFDKDFQFVGQVGGKGTEPGTFDMANSLCRFKKYILVSNRGCDRIDLLDPEAFTVKSFILPQQKDGIFRRPSGICIGHKKKIYVADRHNNCIQIFDHMNRHVSTLRGDMNFSFNQPTAVELDSGQNLIIADRENHRILRHDGKSIHEIVVHTGLKSPRDVAVDRADNLYIADTGNQRVVVKSADGKTEKIIGEGICAKSIHISGQNQIIVADFDQNKFYLLKDDVKMDFFDFLGIQHKFKKVRGIFLFGKDIYIADRDDDRIYKFSIGGKLEKTIGGRGPEHGKFRHPAAVKVKDSVVYVVDRDNDRVELFDPNFNHMSTIGLGH